MTRGKLHHVLAAAVALALAGGASDAFAGWRWHGSSGGSSGGWGSSGSWGGSSGGWGSSGSWGSSGGSSGSWGSSGGSSGGWGHHRHHRRGWGSSGGSSGGWYSSGGSSGGWGSSGSWGSSGGSSGGGYYYAPYGAAMPQVMDPYQAVPANPGQGLPPAGNNGLPPAGNNAPPPGGTLPPANTDTSIRSTEGLLSVAVPEDARIFVNGQLTSSTGDLRQYVSRGLKSGYNYTYEVKAEVVRDGKTVEQVKTIDLRAGQTAKLAFDFAPGKSLETSLTVHVPADAKVFLAGNETAATGETRVFKTAGLTEGNGWEGYTIRVVLERDGKTITKEEKISLKAGDEKEISFDFDANGDRVASAR